jgi:hypothetical protein
MSKKTRRCPACGVKQELTAYWTLSRLLTGKPLGRPQGYSWVHVNLKAMQKCRARQEATNDQKPD